MEHIGIDVHKVESQICILTESGEIIECRIRTQRERFAAVLRERASAKIVIEASTESELKLGPAFPHVREGQGARCARDTRFLRPKKSPRHR